MEKIMDTESEMDDIHEQFESIVKLIESANKDLLQPQRIIKRRTQVTSNSDISRKKFGKKRQVVLKKSVLWQKNGYFKQLVILKKEAEKHEQNGKFEKMVYKKINKALYIVQQTRTYLGKKGVEKVTRIVQSILGEYIEKLVAESVQNRLKFMATRTPSYRVKQKAIVEATKQLIRIHDIIPGGSNIR